MLTKEFNRIVKAIKQGRRKEADQLLMLGIKDMTDRQCKKITNVARKYVQNKA